MLCRRLRVLIIWYGLSIFDINELFLDYCGRIYEGLKEIG